MKKIFVVALSAVMLLAGCGKTVIDPDSITEGFEMMKLGGELYYNTERISESNEAAVDTLSKDGQPGEVPKADNSCNFDDATGYRPGAVDGEIDVCIDDKWYVFKQVKGLTDEEKEYKYCKFMQGTLPGSQITDELLVLTDDKDKTYDDVMDFYLNSFDSDKIDFCAIIITEEE